MRDEQQLNFEVASTEDEVDPRTALELIRQHSQGLNEFVQETYALSSAVCPTALDDFKNNSNNSSNTVTINDHGIVEAPFINYTDEHFPDKNNLFISLATLAQLKKDLEQKKSGGVIYPIFIITLLFAVTAAIAFSKENFSLGYFLLTLALCTLAVGTYIQCERRHTLSQFNSLYEPLYKVIYSSFKSKKSLIPLTPVPDSSHVSVIAQQP